MNSFMSKETVTTYLTQLSLHCLDAVSIYLDGLSLSPLYEIRQYTGSSAFTNSRLFIPWPTECRCYSQILFYPTSIGWSTPRTR